MLTMKDHPLQNLIITNLITTERNPVKEMRKERMEGGGGKNIQCAT